MALIVDKEKYCFNDAKRLNELTKTSLYKNCAKCGSSFTTTTKRKLCFNCIKHVRKTVYQGVHFCPRCGKEGRTYYRYTKDKVVEIDVLHREKGKVKHCRFYGEQMKQVVLT